MRRQSLPQLPRFALSSAADRTRDEASLENKGRFVLDDDKQGTRTNDANFSCPKCASPYSSMLETVYREGLPRQVAPPIEREVKGWLLLGFGSALALAALQPELGWMRDAFAGTTIGAAVMGFRATLYNIRWLPRVRGRWENSAMCKRCGHVFLIQP
jgi:hypothetical protein